jgi:phosphoribosylformimino-5-aminoimidazole carboxamide ribotide isomerase
MYIYPAIDLRNGKAVRLKQGDYSQETIFYDDPLDAARQWVDQGADRLHLVDLDGAKAGRPVNEEVIRRIVSGVSVPCELGGGIRSEQDIETVFSWGIHWAVLGSRAVREPNWVKEMAHKYPDRIVLGVDARNGLVATDGWLETSTVSAASLVNQVDSSPVFAIVYTDIAKDGMMAGPNFAALSELQSKTRLPVIASGGVSSFEDVKQLAEVNTFGCIIGRALYDGVINLRDVMEFVTRNK